MVKGSMGDERGSVAAVGDLDRPTRASRVRSLWPHLGFSALLSILFLTFLDNTVISAVLANVQSELHEGVSDLQWVVGAYALTFASLMLISGSLSDNFGRKKVMLIGVAIFCVGSIVCALAGSSSALVVGRVIMGVGAAGSEPGTLSMIRHIYPDPKLRARALGAWAAVSGLALAMGPVLGGALTGFWSWRAVFWFNLAFGGLAFVAAAVALPESSDPTRKAPDFLGFALGALTLAGATFATIAGETSGYRSRGIVTLYCVSALALALFILHERDAKNPMLNLNFFRRRPFVGSTFVAFASYFSIFSIFFFVALYLEVVAMSGAYNLAEDFCPLLGGMILSSIFTGRWVGVVGSRVPMMTGCLIAAVGVAMTDWVIGPGAGIATVGWTMGIAGIGFGIIVVPVTSTALTSIPAANSGMAASTTNTSRELGAVAGVAILGSIVNGQLTVNLTHRLAAVGIPAPDRAIVITAITTGTIGQQEKALSGHSSAAVRHIIHEVVQAAYAAFTNGLNVALTISCGLLLASALVAYFTGTREKAAALIIYGETTPERRSTPRTG
jgi:EmrB/QacA subfamily drug resistance transporter